MTLNNLSISGVTGNQQKNTVHLYAEHANEVKRAKGPGQGLVLGVVFPCFANILGVILFLRLPWIMGKAGVWQGVCVVLFACCVTGITATSLAAVATNGKIQGGGAYFIISRSMGPAIGSAVGVCFFLANSIGSAMYLIGFVEAWEIASPDTQIAGVGTLNNVRATGFVTLAFAVLAVGLGIKMVARVSLLFLFVMFFAIFCMYMGNFLGPEAAGTTPGSYELQQATEGGSIETLLLTWTGVSSQYFKENWGPAYGAQQRAFPLDKDEYSFVKLLAMWFPAVTGFEAGSNRSADLSEPGRDIPRGTFFAQIMTSLIYVSFAILFASAAPRGTLLDDKFFAASSAWPARQCVVYGVMASSIGAGLTSLVSGTRLLAAIAADGNLPILKRFAARPGKEPKASLVCCSILSACAIAIGELNSVAPILTMFFLMCYTCVNLSCAILGAVNDPNWRPTFHFYHWLVSLAGACLCIWLMFTMSWVTALVAIAFCSIILVYAYHSSSAIRYGDGWQGLKFRLVRYFLLKMDLRMHAKNWRPQLLVVTSVSVSKERTETRLEVEQPQLLQLAAQMQSRGGMTLVGGICCTMGRDLFTSDGILCGGESAFDKVRIVDEQMAALLRQHGVRGFGKVIFTEDAASGLVNFLQMAGLGPLQPNCILTSWPTQWQDTGAEGTRSRVAFARALQSAVTFQKLLLITKGKTWPGSSDHITDTIDVWWIVGDGGVLLLLPFIMRISSVWHGCSARLFVLAGEYDDPQKMTDELNQYIKDFRLDLEVHVKVRNMAQYRELSNESIRLTFPPGAGPPGAGTAAQVRNPLDFSSQLGPDQTWSRSVSQDSIQHLRSASSISSGLQQPAMRRQVSLQEFTNKDQLTSTEPASRHEIEDAKSLNEIIVNESSCAGLVLLNLPDLPEGESAFGYCHLVERLTKGIRRCILVGGCATEVITAFT